MAEYRWYSDKDNVNFSTKQRTFALIDTLKRINKGDVDVDVNYIESHLDMIQYEFNNEKKLVKIVVNPYRLFTLRHESKIRQCDNSYGITKLLEKLVTDHKALNTSVPTIEIEMVNESHCKSVKGTRLYDETRPVEEYTETLSVEGETAGDTAGDTAVSAGGSKSRRRHGRHRKHVRKTRRGHRRTRKSKTKTHRCRRHSRARKHKKYTSRK